MHPSPASVVDSVLILFRDYPGNPTLQEYIKEAIADGVLSLPIFLAAFLLAAQSSDLRNAATLDMLCRVVLNHHYTSGLGPLGSLISFGEPIARLFSTVQCAMGLLRTTFELPIPNYHQLPHSALTLLTLLLSCVNINDLSQIPLSQAMMHLTEANYLLDRIRLSGGERPEILDAFALALMYYLGDDAKVTRETQMMHTLPNTMLGSSSESDIVTCSLVLNHLVRSL